MLLTHTDCLECGKHINMLLIMLQTHTQTHFLERSLETQINCKHTQMQNFEFSGQIAQTVTNKHTAQDIDHTLCVNVFPVSCAVVTVPVLCGLGRAVAVVDVEWTLTGALTLRLLHAVTVEAQTVHLGHDRWNDGLLPS